MMKSITSGALFKIGDYEITLTVLLFAALILMFFIVIIAYRYNHRTQQKATKYMDDEALVYNKKGLEKYFKKNRRKFSNPTLVVVEIRNLDYLYTNNQKRNKLILSITDKFLAGLKSIEVVGRIEFDKFLIAYTKLEREQIKEKCLMIERRFNNFVFEEYGQFDFNLFFGIYPSAPLKNKEVIEIASAITKYSNISDGKRYYYCDEVSEAVTRIKRMNIEKDYDFEQKRFVPYIQPKVDFKTGQVVGGEILVRWVDENNKFKYSPAEFIPLFESNGFIKKVDDLMFKHACNLAKTIVSKGRNNVVISVNVSKLNFLAPDFEKRIKANLAECNVNPKNVEIEVTETTVSENFQYVSNCIMSLRQMGFNVAMDDFGQEYSSLGLLSSNPFDTIKLDRIFFRNKLATDKDKHIVRNLLDMLTKLNYKKVCEGVSDKQTLDVLATINQDFIIQGFCISPPIPISQFEAFLDTVFEFNYPPIEEYSNTINLNNLSDKVKAEIDTETNDKGGSNTSINISGLGGNSVPQHDYSKDFEDLRNKMNNMESRLSERHRSTQDEEIRLLKEQLLLMQVNPRTNSNEIEALRKEIDLLRNQKSNPAYIHSDIYSRDDEILRLRREIEDLRYQQDRDRDRSRFDREYFEREKFGRYDDSPFVKKEVKVVDNSGEIEKLQDQIRQLQEQQRNQPQLDVNLLIDKLSKSNELYEYQRQQSETQSLREKLEKERKEKAELEALLRSLQSKDEPEDFEDEEEIMNEANRNLNLDIDALDDFEENDDFLDDEDEEEESNVKLAKPRLTLEELEAIIKSYQERYQDNWSEVAKNELKDGFNEVVDGLKYYKANKKMTFIEKMKNISPETKQIYNIIKNEFMKYNGVTNKVTNSYDCFYLGRNQIAKLSITSKKVKVFMAADPSKYSFPHKDLSNKKVHVRTPYYTLLKSPLSVKRAKQVFEDVANQNNLTINQSYKPVDYVTKFKFLKSSE